MIVVSSGTLLRKSLLQQKSAYMVKIGSANNDPADVLPVASPRMRILCPLPSSWIMKSLTITELGTLNILSFRPLQI